MKKTLPVLLGLLALTGCASGPQTAEYRADRVVGRSDDLSSRPDWVSETVSTTEKGDKLLIVGVVEVPGDSRVQAAFKASDAAARGHLASKVETQLLKLVESSESGFSMEDQKLQSMVREVSHASFHNLDVKSRYWERVVRTKSDGTTMTVMKAFSLLTIPNAEVKQMIADAVRRSKDTTTESRTAFEKMVQSRFLAEDLRGE